MSRHLLIAALAVSTGLSTPLIVQAQLRQAQPARQSVQPARPAAPVARVPVQPGPVVRGPVAVRPVPKTPDPQIERARLRNACFNTPNPPPALCRRVFGPN